MPLRITINGCRILGLGLLLQFGPALLVAQTPQISFRHFSNADGLSQNHVTSILQDRQGFMWFATAEGLNRFDGYEFTVYRHVDNDSTSIPHDNINELFLDSEGEIWVGSVDGLAKYNRDRNTFTSFIHDDANANSVSWGRVNRIIEDEHGNFWIAFLTGMVDYFDRKKNSFTHFPIASDVTGSGIYGEATALMLDKAGNLWIGTFQGITVLNARHQVVHKYVHDPKDPFSLTSNTVYDIIEDGDGAVWVSTGAGMFHPDSIKNNPVVPKVYITDLKIFNKSVPIGGEHGILSKPISETRSITLPYYDNFFSLTFVALNYTSSRRNEYVYRLEGFDKQWMLAPSNRTATYTSLEPGTYLFRVKASNNDGLWNNEGVTLTVRILPPWWKTWWFRLLTVAAAIAATALTILVRTRGIRRLNRRLEETVEQKTRELKQINRELLKREEEIAAKNRKLSEQADELAAQNEELTQTQEKISSQRDQLSHQNENLEEEVQKRTQELLEYTHQLEQFAFISAHNLRAPVARILGLGHLLEMFEQNEAEKKQIYPKLVQTTKELDNVVKDLNTILELKKNNDSFVTTIELEPEVQAVLKSLEREIATSHAKIFTDFQRVGSLKTVKPYLDSVLYNLISNAIKYRHPHRDPVIRITAEQTAGEICISVADNGLGINLDLHREKLFNLYSRFHFHIEGKGMGLYLVKTQLTTLGGRLEVESQVDQGTVFRAYFKT